MSIQRYVDQIIEILVEANLKANPKKTDYEAYIEETMEAVLSEPHTPLSFHTKVEAEELPPFSQLTIQQASAILEALEACFNAYGIFVELPKDLPIDLRYKKTIGLLSEKSNLMPGWHYDFCDGNCDVCDLRDYCTSYQNFLKSENLK